MSTIAVLQKRSPLCAALLLPTLLILAFLIRNGVEYCCDAAFYLNTIEGHRQDGLFRQDDQVGYRGYLFPYFYSFVPFDLSKIAFGNVPAYSLASSFFFLVVEFVTLVRVYETRLFWPTYLAFFVNPLLLVYVPYPISESFLLLAFVGFVPWLLCANDTRSRWTLPAILGLFFGAMYMIRVSNLVLAIPVALLLGGHLRSLATSNARVRSFLLFAACCAIVILPQSALVHRHLGSYAPYPVTEVLSVQMDLSAAYSKYGTNLSGRENQSLSMPSWNPLNCHPLPSHYNIDFRTARGFVCSLTSEFRRQNVSAWVFTGLIHVYGALNYDVLQPYISIVDIPLFSLAQFLSMTVVFLGGYAAILKLTMRRAELGDWFLFGVIAVTLAVTTITAVETRFGLLATASFSLLSTDLVLNEKLNLREWVTVGFGLVLFLAVAALLSIYVLALSGAVSP